LPKIVTIEQSVAYLRALAETANATLAAERAGVSRTWAYKVREVDAGFDARCREMVARFRGVGLHSPSPLPSPSGGEGEMGARLSPPSLPHPAQPPAESPSPSKGRGVSRRPRVNRDRVGGWTAALEGRFLAALAATRDVPLAAMQVGFSATSAYQRRRSRRLGGSFHPSQPNACFAARWRAALADDETFAEAEWVATMICLLDGKPIPPEYPVQTIGVGDVIRLYERSLGVRRGRPMRG
jgi:hypothetical protein